MNVFTLTGRLLARVGVGRWILVLVASAALLVSACDLVGDDEDDQQQSQQGQAQQGEQTQSAASQRPSSSPSAPRSATAGGEGATAYSIIFPSIARVSVGTGAVTGLAIQQGYVVVDGASLAGAASADVQLSNGDTLSDLAVVGRDPLTGLAYLGPLSSNLTRLLPAARLIGNENTRPGSTVYAIGYAAGDAADALPSVRSGVISGFVEWEPGRRTIVRTDIEAGGEVLIDSNGGVLGIAPASLADRGLYISSADLASSLAAAAPSDSGAADVAIDTEHAITLEDGQGELSLLLTDAEPGEQLIVTVRSAVPSALQFRDGGGEILQEAELGSGATIIVLIAAAPAPNEIVITPQGPADEPASLEVRANLPLAHVTEAEDGVSLTLGEALTGQLDLAGDADTFALAVQAGGVYLVTVQSLLVDAYLSATGAGIDATDDDSGGGLFGFDSALTLEPSEDGGVLLAVRDFGGSSTGPYVITATLVSEPPITDAMSEDDAEGGESAMAMSAAALPSPNGDVSVRGEISEDGLIPTLLGIGSELDEDNALIVSDADGVFEITASVIGTDQSTARLLVLDQNDDVLVSGRVVLNCATVDPCLASAVFITPEGGAGESGVWRVLLHPEGAGGGVTEWQIEVFTLDQ